MNITKWSIIHVTAVLCLALSALIPMRAEGSVVVITNCTYDECTTTYMSTDWFVCLRCFWDQSCVQVFRGDPGSNEWCIELVSNRPDGTGGNQYCVGFFQSCDPNGY